MKTLISYESAPLPLGFVVMLIRGATADLSDALTSANSTVIINSKIRLANAVSDYYLSKTMAPKNLVTRELLLIGEDSIIAAETKLKLATDSLRSSFKLIS